MDLMADTLTDGRGFRTLNIVDDFTRECVTIEVDRSLPGARVVRVLERLAATIGLPRILISDNGLSQKSKTQSSVNLAGRQVMRRERDDIQTASAACGVARSP